MSLTIRDIRREDYGEWYAMLMDYDPEIENAELAFDRLFTVAAWTCLVACVDDVPVAFLDYQLHPSMFKIEPVCYISNLYVKPAHRRRGIATKFMDEVFARARDHRWCRVYWITENENPARCMYDKYGEQSFVRYHRDFDVPGSYEDYTPCS